MDSKSHRRTIVVDCNFTIQSVMSVPETLHYLATTPKSYCLLIASFGIYGCRLSHVGSAIFRSIQLYCECLSVLGNHFASTALEIDIHIPHIPFCSNIRIVHDAILILALCIGFKSFSWINVHHSASTDLASLWTFSIWIRPHEMHVNYI